MGGADVRQRAKDPPIQTTTSDLLSQIFLGFSRHSLRWVSALYWLYFIMANIPTGAFHPLRISG